MSTQNNNQATLKPDKRLLLSSVKSTHFNTQRIIGEFCDLVGDMNNDNDLLSFVDFCYWSHTNSEHARLPISAIQNVLQSHGLNHVSKRLGAIHLTYLAN